MPLPSAGTTYGPRRSRRLGSSLRFVNEGAAQDGQLDGVSPCAPGERGGGVRYMGLHNFGVSQEHSGPTKNIKCTRSTVIGLAVRATADV